MTRCWSSACILQPVSSTGSSSIRPEYRDRYGYGSGPRASAVIDGDRVYILGVEGEFFCLELKTGRVIWERNINLDFGVSQDFFGTVGTPLLQGNLLILNVGGRQGPCVVAFHKMTGRAVWTAGKNKWGPSYASPIHGTIPRSAARVCLRWRRQRSHDRWSAFN